MSVLQYNYFLHILSLNKFKNKLIWETWLFQEMFLLI